MTSNNQIRDSRFELLRIIAITFVFLHHSLIGLGLMNYTNAVENNPEKILGISLNAFFIIGVNLFILISGYFGMNFSVSKIVKLVLFCFISSLVSCIGADIESIKRNVYDIIHLHSPNPFVPSYIGVFMLSPLLNKMLRNTTYLELKKIMLLFTIVNVFMGFMLNYWAISADGYNMVNYMYLYLIGAFIRRMPTIATKKLSIIYITSYLFIVIWAYFFKSNYSAFAYNNPFVLLAAISFFLLFAKVKIRNPLINKLATATFSMFLLEPWIKHTFFPLNNEMNIPQALINILAGYITLFIFAYIMTIIVNNLFKYIGKYFINLDNYFKFK